jgi:hypothetical protein
MAQRMCKHIARECRIYSFKRRSALYIFNISDAMQRLSEGGALYKIFYL